MLIHKKEFDIIFADYRNKKALICIPYGNVGDQLIWESCFQLLSYNNISYDKLYISQQSEELINTINYKNYDVIFWSGGGNMGKLYHINYIPRKQISAAALLNKTKFVILPQTWTSYDDIKADAYYAREFKSIEMYEPRAIFCHDLALAYEIPYEINRHLFDAVNNIGYFFRQDIEKINIIPEHNMADPAKICKTYQDYILLASQYSEIHTNRLHFAIIGIMLGRKIKFYPNSYFKNQAIYDSSLKKFSNVEFINVV